MYIRHYGLDKPQFVNNNFSSFSSLFFKSTSPVRPRPGAFSGLAGCGKMPILVRLTPSRRPFRPPQGEQVIDNVDLIRTLLAHPLPVMLTQN
jgi:hypothetical protein